LTYARRAKDKRVESIAEAYAFQLAEGNHLHGTKEAICVSNGVSAFDEVLPSRNLSGKRPFNAHDNLTNRKAEDTGDAIVVL
jgi:hypothetical protein